MHSLFHIYIVDLHYRIHNITHANLGNSVRKGNANIVTKAILNKTYKNVNAK